MQPITAALSQVELGSPIQFLNLTLFPLLVADDATPSYTMLDEALALKTARVTEVSESGSVPELLFVNDGDIPVLLVDGEELVGARQNRILNLTVLVRWTRSMRLHWMQAADGASSAQISRRDDVLGRRAL